VYGEKPLRNGVIRTCSGFPTGRGLVIKNLNPFSYFVIMDNITRWEMINKLATRVKYLSGQSEKVKIERECCRSELVLALLNKYDTECAMESVNCLAEIRKIHDAIEANKDN
jgi:hypothetical protein